MNCGECSWIDVRSARMPLITSHTKPDPNRSSSGPRAWVSMAVTSAETALDGAFIISGSLEFGLRRRGQITDLPRRLFCRQVARGQLHRTFNRKLHRAGLLIDPRIAMNFLCFRFTEFKQRLAPRLAIPAPLQILRDVIQRPDKS